MSTVTEFSMGFFGMNYLMIMNLLWILLVAKTNFYAAEITFIVITGRILRIGFLQFSLLMICLFVTKQSAELSRIFVTLNFSLFIGALLASRYGLIFLQKKLNLIQYDKRRVVIIGNGTLSYKAAGYFDRPDSGYHFVGFFDDNNSSRQGFPVLGKIEECLEYAINNKIDEIYSTILPDQNELLHEQVAIAEKNFIRVKFIPDLSLLYNHKVTLNVENDLPVISFRQEPLEKLDKRFFKRLFDLLFSLTVTVLMLSWLLPILLLLVKLSSKGPVFFIQPRSGRNGRVFNCYKIRTMKVNGFAHEKSAMKDDDRLTFIGCLLRKTNLDELPQFFNVLKGEMSVVGPRPHMLKHTEEYSKLVNKFMIRHFLKPGITGWAQVNGYRGDITGDKMSKRVEHDIWYLENWSFLLDVKIIFKTIWLTIAGDKNAY